MTKRLQKETTKIDEIFMDKTFSSAEDVYAWRDKLESEGWVVSGKSMITTVRDGDGSETHSASFHVWKELYEKGEPSH